jgi:hypothetical protein
MINDRWELTKGVGSSLAAAILGVMLGAIFIGGNPLGALGLLSFTLFGAFVVLLPVFAWLRVKGRLNLPLCYLVVLLAGAVGGYLMPWIMWNALGGGSEADDPSGFFLIGAMFGTVTALWWVFCHAVLSLRD